MMAPAVEVQEALEPDVAPEWYFRLERRPDPIERALRRQAVMRKIAEEETTASAYYREVLR